MALGFSWADVTATQVYTIFEIHPLLADEFVRRGAMSGGLVWHFARPPVQGLDFEVDVRGVACPKWFRSRRPALYCSTAGKPEPVGEIRPGAAALT